MRPKKHLGQHFLTAPAYAEKIADAIPCTPGERLLEIGPGYGALSIHLKRRFPDFHLVEVDKDAVESLKQKLGEGKFTLHHGNVLEFDYAEAGLPLHVTGNLPYNIGAHIIKKTLLYGSDILSCTFMLQKEVVQRIVAPPHSKTNGFLSIFCQFFGKVKLLFSVPPGAFFPPPNVDSAVFQLIVDRDIESKLPREQWKKFFKLVDVGFSMRRKQLAKVLSLRLGRDKAHYSTAIKQLGINENARAEDLDVELWLELYRGLEL
ncbi:16S ribosomal RNA methyltransferase KsgA/Dim1 family protein [Chitinispirillum alkaliphilum]|nr:16S ribosomal RNA methyltransferase KsgA/Dim1 family protein [Chitinispirillum alkaliphilum]